MPDKVYQGLPFEEAIAYFQGKVKVPTKRWNDLWQGMHARGFMVAGAIQDDVLTGFYEAIDHAISKGTTLADFQKDFDNIVKKTGWTYNGTRGWRSKLIFETNLFTAYQAGRHAQMTDKAVLKARPYWMYRHGDSRNPRPAHLAWDGLVLRADDPWWDTHYPPNGWGCKCTAFALSDDDLSRMGKTGPDEAPETRMVDRTVKQFDPESRAVKEVIHQVPEGIDPGWDYNVGTAAWGKNEAKRMLEAGGKWVEIDTWQPKAYPDRPAKIPIETTTIKPGPPAATEEHLRQLLRQTIGGETAAYTDPRGDVVMITQALIDHYLEKAARLKAHREEFFPFLPDLIRNPFEIWVTFERNDVSGRIRAVKRYVKAIRTDDTHIVGLVADVRKGYALNVTFYQGGLTGVKGLRKGRLLYGRD